MLADIWEGKWEESIVNHFQPNVNTITNTVVLCREASGLPVQPILSSVRTLKEILEEQDFYYYLSSSNSSSAGSRAEWPPGPIHPIDHYRGTLVPSLHHIFLK